MSKGRPDWFKCYKISPLTGFNESLWCYNVEPRFGWNGRVWNFFCSFLSTSLPLLLRLKCQWIQKRVTKMGTWEEPFSLGSSDNDLELRSVFCIFCKHVHIHLPVVTIVAVLQPCTIPYHRHHLDETAFCTHPLCFLSFDLALCCHCWCLFVNNEHDLLAEVTRDVDELVSSFKYVVL